MASYLVRSASSSSSTSGKSNSSISSIPSASSKTSSGESSPRTSPSPSPSPEPKPKSEQAPIAAKSRPSRFIIKTAKAIKTVEPLDHSEEAQERPFGKDQEKPSEKGQEKPSEKGQEKPTLLDLPDELLLTIAHSLPTDRDIHAFSKSNHRLFALLNPELYLQNATFRNASALTWAARTGNVPLTKHILDLERVESTATLAIWRSALHLSIRRGHADVVRLLCAEEPVLQELAKAGWMCAFKPLTCAASARQTHMLGLLLETMPRVHRPDAWLALRYAELLGEEEAAAMLRGVLEGKDRGVLLPMSVGDAQAEGMSLVRRGKTRGTRIQTGAWSS